MPNNILIDTIINALQNKLPSVPKPPIASQGVNRAAAGVTPPVSIPTPPGAMNSQGITVPGQQPGSLGSDQAINSIFEQDQRGGQLPAIIQQILASRSQAQPVGIPTPPELFMTKAPGIGPTVEPTTMVPGKRLGFESDEAMLEKFDKSRETTKQEKHPDFPDAIKEDGIWKVTINGKKYRIEE